EVDDARGAAGPDLQGHHAVLRSGRHSRPPGCLHSGDRPLAPQAAVSMRRVSIGADGMDEASVDALRSVDIGGADVETSLAFFTDTWNLRLEAKQDGVYYLRGTGPHRYIVSLREAGRLCLLRVVFGTRNRDGVDALFSRASEAGLAVSSPKALDWPGGG